MEPRYVIGIDLGTTNSALAYAEVTANPDPFAPANVQLLPVPQLENPGEVRDEGLLPSFLYLPGHTRSNHGPLTGPAANATLVAPNCKTAVSRIAATSAISGAR